MAGVIRNGEYVAYVAKSKAYVEFQGKPAYVIRKAHKTDPRFAEWFIINLDPNGIEIGTEGIGETLKGSVNWALGL